MECSTSASYCQSLSPLLGQICEDPRVARLLNTRLGQYLRQNPVLALSALLFSSMAVLPVGLFTVFALVTLVMSAVGFVFFEVLLLLVAGLTLLFTLSGLAFFSVVTSFIFGAVYITFTNLYQSFSKQRPTNSRPTAAEEEAAEKSD